MNSYCTQCGAAVNSPAQKKRYRWLWWLLAVVLMFALGFWLGHRLAPAAPSCPRAGNGAVSGGGGGGKGSPGKRQGGQGGGGGGGGGSADGEVQAHGGGLAGGDGSGGDLESGGGGGDSPVDSGSGGGSGGQSPAGRGTGSDSSDDAIPAAGGGGGRHQVGDDTPPGGSTTGSDLDMVAGVMKMSKGGKLDLGVPQGDSAAEDSRSQNLSARDLRYDKTGLPHYASHLVGMASGINYRDKTHQETYGTSAAISTTDSFDMVLAWYQHNLPPGWSSNSLSDLQRLGAQAKALNPASLLQMLNGQKDATAATDVPETAAADRIRLAILNPPPNTSGEPGIMIVQKGDNPVQAFNKRRVP